jgi:GNAT superfamily N-acetyltransferase
MTGLQPYRAGSGTDWGAVLALIQREFGYMEGRIDPPSSMHALTEAAIAAQAAEGEVWLIGAEPLACVFLTPKPPWLYVGKLAVAGALRGQGLARQLIEVAAQRAKAQGLAGLQLQTRVELVENHAAFAALGFVQTDATAHEGFDRPTSLTFTRPFSSAPPLRA